MKSLIISCKTLENELNAAMEACQVHTPVVWLNSSLHNVKEKLRDAVQEALDTHTQEDRIFFAAGFCGNALEGLQNRQAELIIPRTDDCISMLLNGVSRKFPYRDSYFLTEGWLKGELSILVEYKNSLARYGPKRTERIFQAMLRNYRSFSLLDTGCYDVSASMHDAELFSETFQKSLQVIPASNQYLRELLIGPWSEERFLRLPPGQVLTASRMQLYQD